MQSLKQSDRSVTLNVCTCGKIQFGYGPITLHFEPDDFAGFASAVGRLFARYQQLQTAHSTGAAPLLHSDLCH